MVGALRLLPVLTLAVFPSLFVAACGAQSEAIITVHNPCSPVTVAPAEGTTADQRASVSGALELWNSLGFTRLTLEASDGGSAIPVIFRDGPEPFHGIYEDGVGDVVINQNLTDPAAATVVIAHELGHAMGLLHVAPSERRSVMNQGNLDQVPTAEDGAALASFWSHCEAAP